MGPSGKLWTLLIFSVLMILAHNAEASNRFEQKSSFDYTIVINCAKRGADLVMFLVGPDTGNAEQTNSFHFDPEVPRDCQQTSTDGYSGNIDGAPYHRGHYLAFNTRDTNDALARETNVMTNIAPMTRSLNVGVYYETELLTECYRELDTLNVFTGPIWGTSFLNDFFVETHGTETPDYIWKLIWSPKATAYIAWIFPNTHDVSEKPLAHYQVSFIELNNAILADKKILGPQIPWPSELIENRTGVATKIITWDYARSGRHNVTCQGITTSIG